MGRTTSTKKDYDRLINAVGALADRMDALEKSQKKQTQTTIRSSKATKEQTGALDKAGVAIDTVRKKSSRLNAETMKMIETMRRQGKTFEEMGISSEVVGRAVGNQSEAVTQLRDKYNEAVDAGVLQVRNNRLLSGSFAVLRSKLLLVSFAVMLVKKSIGQLMDETQQYQEANLKLQNTIKTTGGTALLTSKDILIFADAIQDATYVSNSLVMAASSIMLTFTQISGETFKDAIKISLDLSKAFDQDLKQSVIQVGKALNDPILGVGALRRIGVSFSKTQKEMIENFIDMNDLAGAQGVILRELQVEIGGTAEAMADADIGAWNKLWVETKDIMRDVGVGAGVLVKPFAKLLNIFVEQDQAYINFLKTLTGSDYVQKTQSNVDLVDTAFGRFKATLLDLDERELKQLHKSVPGLAQKIMRMGTKSHEANLFIDEFKDSMKLFDSTVRQVEGSTKRYNKELERSKEILADNALLVTANNLLKKKSEGASNAELATIKSNNEFLLERDRIIKAMEGLGIFSPESQALQAQLDILAYKNELEKLIITQEELAEKAKKKGAQDKEDAKDLSDKVKLEKDARDEFEKMFPTLEQYKTAGDKKLFIDKANKKVIEDLIRLYPEQAKALKLIEKDPSKKTKDATEALKNRHKELVFLDKIGNKQVKNMTFAEEMEYRVLKAREKGIEVEEIQSMQMNEDWTEWVQINGEKLTAGQEYYDMLFQLIGLERAYNEELGNQKKAADLKSFMTKYREEDLEEEMNRQVKEAEALGAHKEDIKKIEDHYRALKSEADEAATERELDLKLNSYQQLANAFDSFASDSLSAWGSKLDKEMKMEVDIVKSTSAYKLAKRRGDDKKVEQLEKEARNKNYSDRVSKFRADQALAISNIWIDYAMAYMKSFAQYGPILGMTAGTFMTGLAMLQTGLVMAQPKPKKFGLGGDFITSGPENIIVGDNPGGRERVSVTPLSSPNTAGPQGGSPITVNVSGNVMSKDYVEGELAEQIKDAVRRGEDFGLN